MQAFTTSVIMPVHNGATFVGEALESALCQLDSRDQVIVIDDGSTDATPAVLQTFQAHIITIAGAKRGASAARNAGLKVAEGRLIAFLDHDDLWPPDRHRALLHAFMPATDWNAATGRIRILRHDGAIADPYSSWDGQYMPGMLATCLFKRELLEAVGPFDELLTHGEDNDFYLRLGEANMNLALCDTDALLYRRHATNASNAAPSKTKVMMDLVTRRLARRRSRQAGDIGTA